VIIDNFNIIRIASSPSKANAPALVDTDAVLSLPIADKLLKMISGRNAQIIQRSGSIEDLQLAACVSLDLRWKLARELTAEDPLSFLVRKTFDHKYYNNA
jgi:hypothetical protein